MSETDITSSIKEYVNMTGGIAKRLNSGKLVLSSVNKFGKTTYRAVKLEDEGTTDLVVFIKGITYWVETKKNLEEYNKWLQLEERYNKGEKLPKSYTREEAQIKEKNRIIRKGGNHILTYSLVDFISKIK